MIKRMIKPATTSPPQSVAAGQALDDFGVGGAGSQPVSSAHK
jgi:hypothetical protein